MIEGETPEEYQRRLARERQARFIEQHPEFREEIQERYNVSEKGKARTRSYQQSEKGKQTRQAYRSGSDEYKLRQSIYQSNEQGKAAHERYVSSEKAKETRSAYNASPAGQARMERQSAKRREERAAKKEQGSSLPAAQLEPSPPQSPQSELERAAANREMVAKNERAKPYKEKGGRPKKGENVHRWWRKLW